MLPSKAFNENDIIEWCQNVELDIIGNPDGMFHYVGWQLPVLNGRAKLPCNVWRILDVYTTKGMNGSRIPFTRLPGNISFGTKAGLTSVYIDYIGTPIDIERGIPLIQTGHEAACVAYCIYMMHYEEGISGKLPAFQMMKADMQAEILAACGDPGIQNKTRKELNDLMACAYDLTPYLAALKLVSGKFV